MNTSAFKAEAEAIARAVLPPRIPETEYRLAPENFSDIRPLLNETLRKCASSGGGRVVLPAGRYRCSGPILMQSRTELHLEEGCFVKFAPDPALFLPVVPARWGGVDLWNYSPLVYGDGLTDSAL
ncbi:MAG: glycoside hydrolase family 28 protein, partial [Lentisphaeria bacterium]|nr:glycoside hydrolase family 28 protein [Lentisphaeria bacterium]